MWICIVSPSAIGQPYPNQSIRQNPALVSQSGACNSGGAFLATDITWMGLNANPCGRSCSRQFPQHL